MSLHPHSRMTLAALLAWSLDHPGRHERVDGTVVAMSPRTAFEPDALVHCGPRLADDAKAVAEPILVVEILSPSTKHVDTGRKLEGYFRVASVMHDLIVDPARPMVIHRRRGAGGMIETRIASVGTLRLEPPGLTLTVADVFAGTAP